MATDKKSFGQRLQDFMSSYRGKVIMNYAYSWGAAIVIAMSIPHSRFIVCPVAEFLLIKLLATEQTIAAPTIPRI